MEKSIGIVLAAGQGRRMQTAVQKQYLLLGEKPILAYSLKAFEESFIDEVILVVEAGFEEYCRKEIVEKYHFHKVKKIIPGGKERYHSVFCGLQCIEAGEYVYIHDGARPFLSQAILERARQTVRSDGACVVGMPVKDTIKIADGEQFVESTPQRSRLWQVQTPQVFALPLIKEAYEKLMAGPIENITDDAMVAEAMLGTKVRLVEGSYENMKITTKEDLALGEILCGKYW